VKRARMSPYGTFETSTNVRYGGRFQGAKRTSASDCWAIAIYEYTPSTMHSLKW
jgi:hypothetical protein